MSRSLDMTPVGLPHSDISGSKRACRSPKLFAACHVLHRLSVPRHPPSTLSNLTIKCLDLMRSAVESSKSDSSCILYLQPVFNCQRTNLVAKTGAALQSSRLKLTAGLAKSRSSLFCCGHGVTNPRQRLFQLSHPIRVMGLVELIGIEPTTPCLQSRCSPN
jgi:hypothetical protein